MRALLCPMLCVVAASACERPRPQPGAEEQPPDIQLSQVHLRTYRGGTTSVTATAPTLGFHREGPLAGQVLAREVIIDSTAGLHVEAKTVQGDAVGGLLEGLTVHAVGSGGATFDSPRAFFDRNQGAGGTASTDAGVVVHHPGFVLEGQRGWADIAEERVELFEVTTRLR